MMTATTYSSVQVNHYETAYWQMESLIKNGHSHICMLISSKIDTSVYRLRWQAYEDAPMVFPRNILQKAAISANVLTGS